MRKRRSAAEETQQVQHDKEDMGKAKKTRKFAEVTWLSCWAAGLAGALPARVISDPD